MKLLQRAAMVAAILLVALSLMPISSTHAQVGGQLKPEDTDIFNSLNINCLSVKLKLTQVHESDGLLRVTLGQSYDTVSSKLMAPMNARAVQNKLDASEMIKITADFEKRLDDFRNNYKSYEVAMSSLLNADCRSQMQTFYASLQSIRVLRAEVNDDVMNLNKLMDTYYSHVSKLKETLKQRQDEAEKNTNE